MNCEQNICGILKEFFLLLFLMQHWIRERRTEYWLTRRHPFLILRDFHFKQISQQRSQTEQNDANLKPRRRSRSFHSNEQQKPQRKSSTFKRVLKLLTWLHLQGVCWRSAPKLRLGVATAISKSREFTESLSLTVGISVACGAICCSAAHSRNKHRDRMSLHGSPEPRARAWRQSGAALSVHGACPP